LMRGGFPRRRPGGPGEAPPSLPGKMTMRPLDGIRVVDLTRFLAGPYCTQELGDFGADIIKVEPLDGDGTRDQTLRQDLLGNSYFFAAANRNKRSITVDVRKDAGK